jgi:tubulin monoglycylase TTLL3/8
METEHIEIKTRMFRSRTVELLKQLNMKNRIKEEAEKAEKLKIQKIITQHRKQLGVIDIKPKLYEPIEIQIKNDTNSLFSAETNHTEQKLKKKKKKKKLKNKKLKEKVLIEEKIIKFKNCYTLEDWKRKNKISAEKKIFVCFPGYPDMRNGLLNRGWIENKDPESIFFDMIVSLGGKDIDYDKLNKLQMINHFQKNSELTRKVCLAKNLKNLVWIKNVDIDTFFPRCYDLTDIGDIESFCDDFKICKIENILNEYCYHDKTYPDDIIKTCIIIIERRLKNLDEVIDTKYNGVVITDKEWERISGERKDDTKRSHSVGIKGLITHKKLNSSTKNIKRISLDDNVKYKEKVKELLNILNNNPQSKLNKDNIWILKPSGLSRGRGIKCVDNLQQILSQVRCGGNQYIIQKYIENPMIIMNRKFDIRQWVMVTDFNPLTIWLYDTPYLRFGAEDYDPNNLNNLYSHLTNNAIAKNSAKFKNSCIEGNMWHIQNFKEHINVI